MKFAGFVPFAFAAAFGIYTGYCYLHAHSPQADPNNYEVMAAFYVGMPLALGAAVTAFLALRKTRQWRFWIPLGIGLLPPVAFVVGLMVLFPIAAGVVVALAAGGWGFGWWWRKRQHVKLGKPELRTTPERPPPIPPPPVPAGTTPMAGAPPPRARRRPVCGILAWALPLLAVPGGLLIAFAGERVMDTSGAKGFGLMGLVFLPAFLSLAVSPILAIVSLCRHERWPGLGCVALFLCVLAVAVAVPFGGLLPLLVLAGGAVWLVVFLLKRRR